MKVLALPSYSNTGGAELHMARFLEHRPAQVEASVLLLEEGPLEDHLRQLGLAVEIAGDFRSRPGPMDMVRFDRVLASVLRAERPDVVWAIGQKSAVLAVAVCRARRVPIVWHKVDFSFDRWLTKPLGSAVNGVVAVSHSVAEALGPLRAPRLLEVVGVPIGLRPDLSISPARSPLAIGTLSRLVPYKGLHHILGAAELLAPEFPELRVVLAGGEVAQYPRYRAELVAQARRAGLADRLELPGFVSDVESVLRHLTVFVSATHRDEQGFGLEGLGAGLLEASWAGLPVVAARTGGEGEAVVDGVTGMLVNSAEPPELAAAIARYLREPQTAAAAGAAGRAFARERGNPELAASRLFAALARVTRDQPGL